jgi:hypothetical protein
MLVSGSVMRISAPVNNALCGSVTCPDTVPDDADCAAAGAGRNTSATAKPSTQHAEIVRARKLVNLDCLLMIPHDPQSSCG